MWPGRLIPSLALDAQSDHGGCNVFCNRRAWSTTARRTTVWVEPLESRAPPRASPFRLPSNALPHAPLRPAYLALSGGARSGHGGGYGPGTVAPAGLSKTPVARPAQSPFATPASAPYTPAQVRHAYGFDQVKTR